MAYSRYNHIDLTNPGKNTKGLLGEILMLLTACDLWLRHFDLLKKAIEFCSIAMLFILAVDSQQ